MSRDARALDVQDLQRCIRELGDVFDSPEWRNEPLTGALVASALRKAAYPGSRRGSMLSQKLRAVIRRTVRRRVDGARPHLVVVDEIESHT